MYTEYVGAKEFHVVKLHLHGQNMKCGRKHSSQVYITFLLIILYFGVESQSMAFFFPGFEYLSCISVQINVKLQTLDSICKHDSLWTK